MATSPSPFFFPTTAPAYASTTVFPPPSFGFGATAYPYPPPASAYMPASGFSPNWPPPAPKPPPFAPHAFPPTAAYPPTVSGCSPAPIYPFHPTFPSPISSQINPNRPPPAPTPIHGDLHHTVAHPLVLPHPLVLAPPPESSAPPAADSSSSPAVNQLTPTSACAPVATTGNWMQQHRVPTGLNDLAPQLKLFHRSLPDREMDTFQRHTWGTTALARLPLDGFLTDAFDHAPEVTSSAPTSMPQFFSSAATGIGFGSSASSTPTAQTQSSFDTIHGELEKLTSMVSQLAVSIGKRSISAHTSMPVASAAAPAYVAPQVFGEMPTPSSCHGTDATTSNFCSGHHSPIQNSCVQTGDTNLSEQHLDGRQHHYGFDNFICQTVFRADGSEHSYFALPENYPLKLATPEPMFNVDDDKADGCSNEFVDVFTGHWKLQQQDDEKTSNCLVIKASDSVFTRPNHFSLEHSMRDTSQSDCTLRYRSRKEQSPEHINCTTGLETAKLNFEQEDILISGAVTNVAKYKAWKIVAPSSHCMNHAKLRLEWDPGDTKLNVLFTTAAGDTKLQCIDIDNPEMLLALNRKPVHDVFDCALEQHQQLYEDERSINDCEKRQGDEIFSWDIPEVKLLFICPSKAPIDIIRDAFSGSQCPIFADLQYQLLGSTLCIWDPGIRPSSSMCCWLQSLTTCAVTEQPSSWLQTPVPTTCQSQVTAASYVWDPSIWSLFTEEKERVTLIPKQWSCSFNAMHYYQIFQKCNGLSFQQYSHQDINLIGIPLWLINFQIP